MKEFRLVLNIKGKKVKGDWLNASKWTIKQVMELEFPKDFPDYEFEFR